MFGRSFFSDFRDDPFFSGFNGHFREMDSFFNGGRDEFPALPAGASRPHGEVAERGSGRRNELTPFGSDPFGMGAGFGSLFGNMGQMFNELNRQMENSHNAPNSYSYSQSSVMTYSNTGDGEPKIYQATTSSRKMPGGVRETRKAVRDSDTGIERLEVGHHIGSKGKVVEREVNMRTGQQNERSDLVGMRDEDEIGFLEEWRQRTRANNRFSVQDSGNDSRPALTDGRTSETKKSKKSRKPEYYVEEA